MAESMKDAFAREQRLLGSVEDATKIEKDLAHEIMRCTRSRQPLSIVLVRISPSAESRRSVVEPFQRKLVTTLQTQLSNELRFSDIYGRLGAREFLVILPNTDFEGARVVERRLSELGMTAAIHRRCEKFIAEFWARSVEVPPLTDAVGELLAMVRGEPLAEAV